MLIFNPPFLWGRNDGNKVKFTLFGTFKIRYTIFKAKKHKLLKVGFRSSI